MAGAPEQPGRRPAHHQPGQERRRPRVVDHQPRPRRAGGPAALRLPAWWRDLAARPDPGDLDVHRRPRPGDERLLLHRDRRGRGRGLPRPAPPPLLDGAGPRRGHRPRLAAVPDRPRAVPPVPHLLLVGAAVDRDRAVGPPLARAVPRRPRPAVPRGLAGHRLRHPAPQPAPSPGPRLRPDAGRPGRLRDHDDGLHPHPARAHGAGRGGAATRRRRPRRPRPRRRRDRRGGGRADVTDPALRRRPRHQRRGRAPSGHRAGAVRPQDQLAAAARLLPPVAAAGPAGGPDPGDHADPQRGRSDHRAARRGRVPGRGVPLADPGVGRDGVATGGRPTSATPCATTSGCWSWR